MSFKSIEDFDLNGKVVFLRLDLNVPLKNGQISDDTRIQAALPSLRYALDRGAKLVVASHLGRPKSAQDRELLSLAPVAERVGELLQVEVLLVEEPGGDAPKALLSGLKPKQIIMLENLRFDEGETKNSKELAQAIASYTDIYINDAFGASHRAHASVVGVPELLENKGVGFLIRREVEMLDKVLHIEERPFVVVLGGAKVSDKMAVIESLVKKVDTLIIGGAMAYTFLMAKGCKVGRSLVEKDKLTFAKELVKRFEVLGKELLLPVDHRVVADLKQSDQLVVTTEADIDDPYMGVDIGPRTEKLFSAKVLLGKTVFWNGPMGIFETPAYAHGTFAVAQALAANTHLTIVGGGDSAAAMNAAGVSEDVTHISTGGGASLEYLQGDALPGIEVLKMRKQK